jgi:peptidase M42 family hydrolase
VSLLAVKPAPKPRLPEHMRIDMDYVLTQLRALLDIHSPAGYTDTIVRYVCGELHALGIDYEITRRGAIRANFPGKQTTPDRAVVAHLDTLGAMVKRLKKNGRLALVPVGSWSSRFAEGARCTIYTEAGNTRGTILPMKASGHTYNTEVDSQPTEWSNLEIRVDEKCSRFEDLVALGFNVGDFIAIDSKPEFSESGFVNSRHLDDKAGVAAMMGAAKAIQDSGRGLPVSCHMIFTIAEEVGLGVPGTLARDVAEVVAVDNGTIAPEQNTAEYGVTIAMQDETGPFDYHLTRKLIGLCRDHDIPYARDVFKFYRSDAAAAVAAGNDLRTALVCFALDASHGYERTHIESLQALGELLAGYMMTDLTFAGDTGLRTDLDDFPTQPE